MQISYLKWQAPNSPQQNQLPWGTETNLYQHLEDFKIDAQKLKPEGK